MLNVIAEGLVPLTIVTSAVVGMIAATLVRGTTVDMIEAEAEMIMTIVEVGRA